MQLKEVASINCTKSWVLEQRRDIHRAKWFYKIINGLTPGYLKDLIPQSVQERTQYSLRGAQNLTPMQTRLESFSRSFIPSSVRLWNSLSETVRNCMSLHSFSRSIAVHYAIPNKPKPWYLTI